MFKTHLGKELGINFPKSSNEEGLSNSTYYNYFFILFKAIRQYTKKRNRRYLKDF